MNASTRTLGLAPILLAVLCGCGYNTIQTYDEQVNAAESQISGARI